MNRPILSKPFLTFHLRVRISHAYGVVTMMSMLCRTAESLLRSSCVKPTRHLGKTFIKSIILFSKSDLKGSITTHFFFFYKHLYMLKRANENLPDPSAAPKKQFLSEFTKEL